MTIKNKISSIFLLPLVLIMILSISFHGSSQKVEAESVCADCEMNNTCVVTCMVDPNYPNRPNTPICSNYGQDECTCADPTVPGNS